MPRERLSRGALFAFTASIAASTSLVGCGKQTAGAQDAGAQDARAKDPQPQVHQDMAVPPYGGVAPDLLERPPFGGEPAPADAGAARGSTGTSVDGAAGARGAPKR